MTTATINRHRSGPTLAQAMPCCLTAITMPSSGSRFISHQWLWHSLVGDIIHIQHSEVLERLLIYTLSFQYLPVNGEFPLKCPRWTPYGSPGRVRYWKAPQVHTYVVSINHIIGWVFTCQIKSLEIHFYCFTIKVLIVVKSRYGLCLEQLFPLDSP